MFRELRTPPSLHVGWRVLVTAGVLALMVGTPTRAPDRRDQRTCRVSDTPPASLFSTTWFAQEIDADGVIDEAGLTLVLRSAGHVAGSGGCNSFSGPVTINGDAITWRSGDDEDGLLAGNNEPGTEILCRPRRDPLYRTRGPYLMFYDAAETVLVKLIARVRMP
jgi:META domain